MIILDILAAVNILGGIYIGTATKNANGHPTAPVYYTIAAVMVLSGIVWGIFRTLL